MKDIIPKFPIEGPLLDYDYIPEEYIQRGSNLHKRIEKIEEETPEWPIDGPLLDYDYIPEDYFLSESNSDKKLDKKKENTAEWPIDGPLLEYEYIPEVHTLGVSSLRKSFGKKEVVKGVNFTMKNGEVAGLLGPNGAGKTTIFYMIVGFYAPSEGIVLMDDTNITGMPMYRRARMGIAYLPQEASIFRKLTVEQNIWAILESRQDLDLDEKKEKLERLLNEFGIVRIRSQFGYTLSGGERRRTEIARALATEPKFLLLDEPFAGIDPIAVFEIKQIIRRLAEKGIGVLITDHNVRDTLEITSEAFIIADGNIFARGNREAILNDERVRQIYLGSEFRM